jgi:hypothetical protein
VGGSAVAGGVFAGAWTLASRVTEAQLIAQRRPGEGMVQIVRDTLVERYPFYARQVVGQFGYGEVTISPLAVLAWYALAGVVVAPALWYGGRRVRIAITGLLASSLAVLTALEVHYVPLVGWYSQGRYLLPAAAGVVLLPAASTRFAARFDRLGPMPALVALGTVPLHLYALVRVLSRFEVGIEASLRPFDGSWRPVLGPLPPLLACLIGALLLSALVAAATRPAQRHPDPPRPVAAAQPGDACTGAA